MRNALIKNPHEALTSHGFALEDAELAEIETIQSSVGSAGGHVEQKLITVTERYGVHPRAEN